MPAPDSEYGWEKPFGERLYLVYPTETKSFNILDHHSGCQSRGKIF
jgi:hypothetical protein